MRVEELSQQLQRERRVNELHLDKLGKMAGELAAARAKAGFLTD